MQVSNGKKKESYHIFDETIEKYATLLYSISMMYL
jgi:hypothetical protein